jgi:hypothetical protein
MGDTTDVMASRTFLEICRGIERLCADLYHFYSDIYEDIPEAASLWKKTALEEENHQMQFELALRLMDETEFEVSKESLKRAFSIQTKLLKLTDHVKGNKPELLMAVSKAVEMEDQLANLHVHTSIKFKEESMQKLFKALGDDDYEHVAALQRYSMILHLPHSEMRG